MMVTITDESTDIELLSCLKKILKCFVPGHERDCTHLNHPRYPLTIDIAEHLRTRNHQNIVPINEKSYVKISRSVKVSSSLHIASFPELWTCKHCDKQFKQKQYLGLHIKTVHEGVWFKCSYCGKQFGQKGNLKRHVDTVHKMRHIQKIERKDDIKFQCHKCDKKFLSRTGVHYHVQSVHEGIKFRCDKCHKQFTSKVNLNLHYRNVHDGMKGDNL